MPNADAIQIENREGQVIDTQSLADFLDYTIQDDEIGLRVARDLLAEGRYCFVGDGVDEATDLIFTVLDHTELANQIEQLADEIEG